MISDTINNIRISHEKTMLTPEELKQELPLSQASKSQIDQFRQEIIRVLTRKDPRLLVVCGPCSIHDPKAALEYAEKLKTVADHYRDQLLIVMRAYFEKPRTTVGWKGLINDPHMDNSFDIEYGLRQARKLLIQITEMGLPIATEALDPNTPQYIGDLISWSAIGARTTESQTHREMASGLSMPVGFKNGTDGSLMVAINAMQSATNAHRFIGINQQGQVSILQTKGNPYGHIILRGGLHPNYDESSIEQCERIMVEKGLTPNLMIDCSHGNSHKDYRQQPQVIQNIASQIEQGNQSIIGLMIESHLFEGSQCSEQPKEALKYGISVTDACLGWDETELLLQQLAEKIAPSLRKRVVSSDA